MNSLLSDKDFETVRDLLVEQLGVESDQLTLEAHLRNDLGADSLTEIEIGMALEERFSLSIPDDQLENVRTVGDIYELLAKLLAPQSPR